MAAGNESVIVAYDGSAAARQAVVAASTLLAARHILVVTVWEPGLAYLTPTPPVDGMMLSPRVDPEFAREVDDSMHQQAERLAREGAELAKSLGLEAEQFPIPDAGDIAQTLVELAGERHAPAIVVGSRGLSGLRARLEGSTSKGVLADAPCPVLVVHEPHEPE